MTNTWDLLIQCGDHRHETIIGPIFTDRELHPSVAHSIAQALQQRGLQPCDVVAALPLNGESGDWHFTTCSPRGYFVTLATDRDVS
jgi:hypothetical protein